MSCSGRRDPVRRPLATARRDITRLKIALNSTSHTLRMDITGIPDSKVAAECATWKPVNFCGQSFRPLRRQLCGLTVTPAGTVYYTDDADALRLLY